MRTVIEQDYLGHVNLVVDGKGSPKVILRKFLALQKGLFPNAIARAEKKPIDNRKHKDKEEK